MSPGEWIGLSGKSLLCNISSTFDSWNDEGKSTNTLDPPSLISKRGRRPCFVASVVTKGLTVPLLCPSLPVGVDVGVCVDAVVTGVLVDKPFITRTFSTNSFLS